ncbi:Peptidase S9B, dipeptidylpeptidase IV domain protein [Balamuthia mandrillaris]
MFRYVPPQQRESAASSSSASSTTTGSGRLRTTALDEKGSVVHYCPNFLTKAEADALFHHLKSDVPFQAVQRSRRGGEQYTLPRLQGWMAAPYTTVSTLYQKTPPTPWTEEVLKAKGAIEEILDNRCVFDYVLLNLYRDGSDSIAFHRDDEAEGFNAEGYPKCIIASISLGAKRKFVMQPLVRSAASSSRGGRGGGGRGGRGGGAERGGRGGVSRGSLHSDQKIFWLEHGSLLVMDGATQEHWAHSVPKDPSVKNERINLTFRVA